MEAGMLSTWVLGDSSSLVCWSCFLAQELSVVSSDEIKCTNDLLNFYFISSL